MPRLTPTEALAVGGVVIACREAVEAIGLELRSARQLDTWADQLAAQVEDVLGPIELDPAPDPVGRGPKCAGLTAWNDRCRNRAPAGELFCWRHAGIEKGNQ